VFAYVYDPGRSREDLAATERELAATSAHVERVTAGGLTVFIVQRGAPAGAPAGAPPVTPP
jgi:hypothetical protein